MHVPASRGAHGLLLLLGGPRLPSIMFIGEHKLLSETEFLAGQMIRLLAGYMIGLFCWTDEERHGQVRLSLLLGLPGNA